MAISFGIATIAANSVLADPKIETLRTYYEVRGASGKALKAQMKKLGPKGFWAYTSWYVSWTRECDVKVKITYTFPKLATPQDLNAATRKRWDTMFAALVVHEEQHGQHGINAANEVLKAHCRKAASITRKWARQDKIFDRETRHGAVDGVFLAN